MQSDLSLADIQALLVKAFGSAPECSVHALPMQASGRRYYRVSVKADAPSLQQTLQQTSWVVMHVAENVLPIEGNPQPVLASVEHAFINVHKLFEQRGIAVPKVFAIDEARRAILLEDLGEQSFWQVLQTKPANEWLDDYEQAIHLLVAMHRACRNEEAGYLPYERRMDYALLRWELDHFRQWGLEAKFGVLAPSARAELDACFDELTQTICALPQGFVHRDFQSRNLMWAPRAARSALVVIDFQDALLGPAMYDLVALLCDSYVPLSLEDQTKLIAHYMDAMSLPKEQHAPFVQGFWQLCLQRKLKDAGRFVYLDRVRKTPTFLAYYEPSLAMVQRALEQLSDYQTRFANMAWAQTCGLMKAE